MNVKEQVKKHFAPKPKDHYRAIITQFLYLGIIALIYLFVSIVNFAELKLEWARLYNGVFWFQYILSVALSVIVFFLTVWDRQHQLKRKSPEVVSLTNAIHKFAKFIQYNFSDAFDAHIEALNEEEKLNCYKQQLYAKKRKAIFWARGEKQKEKQRVKYDKLIAAAGVDYVYKKIKYKPVTTNLLYSGYVSSDDSKTERLYFTGYEGLAEYLIPTIIFGVVTTSLMLLVGFERVTSNIDVVIQLIFRILTMGVYTIRGVAYGEYTINVVYLSVLSERRKILASFIKGQGLEIYEDDKLEIFVDTKENINILKQNEAVEQEEEADGLQEILN